MIFFDLYFFLIWFWLEYLNIKWCKILIIFVFKIIIIFRVRFLVFFIIMIEFRERWIGVWIRYVIRLFIV